MDRIKLLLVEDDIFYQKTVVRVILANFPQIRITKIVSNVREAKESIREEEPHVLVLDVNIPGAFELVREMAMKECRLVFISSFSEHIRKSLKFTFVDFVLKPFDAIDLIIALDGAISERKNRNYHIKLESLLENIRSKSGVRKLVIQGAKNVKVADIYEIVWAEAVFNRSRFYFSDGSELLSPVPLRRYELLLKAHGFMRCHQRILVNVGYVRFMEEETNRLYLGEGLYVSYEQRRSGPLKHLIKQYSMNEISKLHA